MSIAFAFPIAFALGVSFLADFFPSSSTSSEWVVEGDWEMVCDGIFQFASCERISSRSSSRLWSESCVLSSHAYMSFFLSFFLVA